MGLRNAADMQPAPIAEPDAAPWAAQRYVDRESQAWTALDLSLIVQDQQFLHVGI
jgi:twitching motility protein PilI